MSIAEDYFRVTNVRSLKGGYAIFSGVPLRKDSYRVNSGKYIITMKQKCSLLPVIPSLGQHWHVKGERQFDEIEMGDYQMRQHTFEQPEIVKCTLPDTGEQLIKFIAKENVFEGIGGSKARALWEALGAKFHSTVRKDTPASRKRLEGIERDGKRVLTDSSIDVLFTGYAKYTNLRDYNWMSQHKIPAPVQQRLIKYHDERSVDAIKSNPYMLMCFGMSFEQVDELIFREVPEDETKPKFKVKKSDAIRLSAAVEQALGKSVEDGHTYTTQDELRPIVKKLLGCKDLTKQAFNTGQHTAQFIINTQTGTYHPTAILFMESVIAKRLTSLAAKKDLFNESIDEAFITARDELTFELEEMQQEAILASLDNCVSCITGGAGTGKTTVLRTVLRAFDTLKYVIHAMTLSGRAAMRLRESVGRPTQTIAAFLLDEMVIPTNDFPNHVLVIDEASMLDVPTMYRIVNHIHPDTIILLSGDSDQLPPIGAGKVLADIVESKAIANTTLDIVKRQEGSTGIPEYSKLINAGTVPKQLSTANGAITFHETHEDLVAKKCQELYAMSPGNTRIMGSTKLMVKSINHLCQKAVNPDGKMLEFEVYGEKYCRSDLKQGDVILFTQNHYKKGIQNGSLGKLIAVQPEIKTVNEIDSSVESELEEDSLGVVELDTGAKVQITNTLLDCMQLGYCITLHKAQGSQFPRIIIALKSGRIVDRAWLYTAITRAECEIHIVGSEKEFRQITESPSNSHKRNCWLSQLLANNTTQ